MLSAALTQAQEPIAAMAGAGNVARAKDPASGIGNAKRDLELIKAANDPARRVTPPAGASLPLPEVTVSGSAFEPARTPSVEPTRAQPVPRRGSNWLVDAMTKTPSAGRADSDHEPRRGRFERSDSSRPGSETRDRDEAEDNVRGPYTTARRDERNSSGERADSERTNAAPAAPDANPLSRYLGDWMTPRDLTLLRPTLEQGRPESAVQGGPVGESVAGYYLTVFGISAATDSNPTASPLPASSPSSPANPYLDAMETRMPFAPGSAVATLTAPPQVRQDHVPPAAVPALPAATPAKPRIPEFARPVQDEKYFKQLKRF